MLGRTCHNRFVTIYSDCFFPIFSFFFDYHLLSLSLALCTKTHTEQNMLVVHDIFFCSCGLVVCVCVYVCCVYIYIIPITAIYRSCAMSESFYFGWNILIRSLFFPRLWALPVLSSDLKVLGLSLALSVTFFLSFIVFLSFFALSRFYFVQVTTERRRNEHHYTYSILLQSKCTSAFFLSSISLSLSSYLSLSSRSKSSVRRWVSNRPFAVVSKERRRGKTGPHMWSLLLPFLPPLLLHLFFSLSIMFWKEDGLLLWAGGFCCTGTFLSCNRYCTLTAHSPTDAT